MYSRVTDREREREQESCRTCSRSGSGTAAASRRAAAAAAAVAAVAAAATAARIDHRASQARRAKNTRYAGRRRRWRRRCKRIEARRIYKPLSTKYAYISRSSVAKAAPSRGRLRPVLAMFYVRLIMQGHFQYRKTTGPPIAILAGVAVLGTRRPQKNFGANPCPGAEVVSIDRYCAGLSSNANESLNNSIARKVPKAERGVGGLAAEKSYHRPGNEDGLTALHVVCEREYDDVLAKMLFEICKDLGLQTIQLDARVRCQRTPLHVALARVRRNLVQLLLRNGGNPNVADDEGSLPLHTILCEKSSQYTTMTATTKTRTNRLRCSWRYSSKRTTQRIIVVRQCSSMPWTSRAEYPSIYSALQQQASDGIVAKKTAGSEFGRRRRGRIRSSARHEFEFEFVYLIGPWVKLHVAQVDNST
ncbi:unnamed protein product [Trichogramma brassicae]|uniref:Uncharacterized protein n=1 Tax=Trichogramma brassicae TaxID=86971 RepID=A0A6H5INE3_9HYME|nr:unnamed protein product [Trichogramma brassicae]